MFTFVFIMKLITEKKKRKNNSSLVRIGNKHINLAKKLKNKNNVPIGRFFEIAMDVLYTLYTKRSKEKSIE